MLLQWKDEYRTGIDEVDYEHQELIALINSVHAKLEQPGSAMTISAFLGDINKAIAAHFALEERQMRERRYDQFREHKTDHERLLDEIREIMDQYEAASASDRNAALGDVLEQWFSNHFRTHDSRLHTALGPHEHP